MTARIKGILFDLGDTLLDFGSVDINSLFEAGGRLAYDYLHSLNLSLPSFEKFHRRQLRAIRWNYLKSHITRREFNSLDVIGRMATRMGHDLTPDQMVELSWKWYEPLSRCATIEPGLRELLERFRDGGLRLGLISNTFVPGEVLDRHLEQLGLIDLLPVRVYSCNVRYRKPHGRVFRLALKQAGLRADETLFVGDSLKADILGARRAGMISVLKDPTGRHDGAKIRPAHRIRKLAELEDIVRQYNPPE